MNPGGLPLTIDDLSIFMPSVKWGLTAMTELPIRRIVEP